MPIHADGPAPYAPTAAVLTVIDGFRNRGLATPFDVSVLERAGVSSSLAPRTLKALELLGLIDGEGRPTAALEELGKAGEQEFPERLAAVLRGAYEEVFQFVEPRDDSPQKVRDAFRVYKPRGQQERMVNLFLGLCAAAGIIDKPKQGRAKRAPVSPGRAQGKATKAPKVAPIKPAPATVSSDARAEVFTPSPPPQTGQHPFIRGLLQTLPEPGSPWPLAARTKWTTAALAAFDLMYELPPKDQKGGA